MADDVQSTITIKATTEGLDEAKAKLSQLAQAQDGVAVASDKQSRLQTSAASGLERWSRTLDEGYRNSKNFEKAQSDLGKAVDQGLVSQERADTLLGLAEKKYTSAGGAAGLFAVAQKNLNYQMVALAGGLGLVGTALSAFGPWGLAAAAGIGLVSNAASHLSEVATAAGQKAIELRKFSDVTGLGITQIKTLTKAAGELGIDSDQVTTGIERFTVQLDHASRGSGELYDQVRRISRSLADELAAAKTTAEAWNVLARARQQADPGQRNALSRAAFGRGGIELGLLLDKTAGAGGIDDLALKMGKLAGATDEQTRRWAQLQSQITATNKEAAKYEASLFTEQMLQRQLRSSQIWVEIYKTMSEAAKLADKFNSGGGERGRAPRTGTVLQDRRAAQENPLGTPAAPPPLPTQADVLADQAKETEKASNAAIKFAADLGKEVAALGNAATTQERYTKSVADLNSEKAQGHLTEEQYQRALALTIDRQQQAIQVANDNLRIAQQTTAAGRAEAQEIATRNRLMSAAGGGFSREEASTQAALQRRTAEAQVNAQLTNQLASLRDQNAVVSATTGVGRMRAQSEATYNQLVRDTRNSIKAAAIAAQELANAQAAAVASAAQQTGSLKNQNDMSRARLADQANMNRNEGSFTNAIEAATAAQQAYNQVLKDTGDSSAAKAQAEQVYIGYVIKAKEALQQQAKAEEQAAEAARQKAIAEEQAADAAASAGGRAGAGDKGGWGSSGAVGILPSWLAPWMSPQDMAGRIQQHNLAQSQFMPTPDQQHQQQDALEQAQLQLNLANAKDDTARAGIQRDAEIKQLMSQGYGEEKAAQIAGLHYQAAMVEALKNNTDAQNANTGALQAQLDPIYTQGHDALHIGYYGEGSGGTARTVTATDWGTSTPTPANSNTPAVNPLIAWAQSHGQYIYAAPGSGLSPLSFADGGIMTSRGRLPLRRYAGGGIASSPQVSIFGEGSSPEAYVPVPSGRIPVEMRGGKGTTVIDNRQFIFNVPSAADLGDRRTQRHLSQSMGRASNYRMAS